MDIERKRVLDRLIQRLAGMSWVAILCATAFSLYVVATSGKEDMTPEQNVVIDFVWPTYTPQKVRYGEYLKAQYEKEHPNVYINLIKTPDPYKKIEVMISGRTTPDVVWMGVGWQIFSDAFMTLDSYVKDDPEVSPEHYFPGLWEACTWRNELKALPSSGQVGVIYYNKDLFDEAGLPCPAPEWTWNDMVRAAKALTRDFDGDGFIDQYGLQLGQVYVLPFLLYGGQVADPEWKTAQFDKPLTEAILQSYHDLMYADKVMPTPVASLELGMLPMFEAGRVAMHAASSYAIESFRKVQFDWDIVPFPWYEFEGEKFRATGLWQEEFAVIWDTDTPEESRQFARCCAGREAVSWAATNGHIVPGRLDAANASEYLASNRRPANMRAFLDSQSFAVPIYPHPWWRRFNLDVDKYLQLCLTGVEGRRISATEALSNMNTVLQRVLDEYNAEQDVTRTENLLSGGKP